MEYEESYESGVKEQEGERTAAMDEQSENNKDQYTDDGVTRDEAAPAAPVAGENDDDDYRPTAKLEEIAELIEQKSLAAGSPGARKAWAGQLEMVERSIGRVQSGESSVDSEELFLASKLVPADEIEAVDERWDDYEKQYEDIEQEIDEGEKSSEVGEIDLLSLRYRQMRLETQGEMMAEGLTWDRLGDLSDDANHLVEDSESPRLRDARKAFRKIDFRDQREVLEQAVGDSVLTTEQATWIWNQWK
ncbi:MAG: hypothetical protein L6437_01350 [Kiritimatiellae bacterium]|nr:hypothetical protein [Kiritimatiellia bacterium]